MNVVIDEVELLVLVEGGALLVVEEGIELVVTDDELLVVTDDEVEVANKLEIMLVTDNWLVGTLLEREVIEVREVREVPVTERTLVCDRSTDVVLAGADADTDVIEEVGRTLVGIDWLVVVMVVKELIDVREFTVDVTEFIKDVAVKDCDREVERDVRLVDTPALTD